MATALRNFLIRNASYSFFTVKCLCPSSFLNCSRIQFKLKGHSHWQNIKFKKADNDFARSKEFGKLSVEIMSAVRGK